MSSMPALVPPTDNERDNLLAYLTQQRYCMRLTAYGLTEAQARQTPTSSRLSVGGLIKHVTAVERGWMGDVVQQRPADPSGTEGYSDGFVMRPDETLQHVLDDSVRCGEETEAIMAGIADLGQTVPVPKDVPWFPDDVDAWSVRWVVLHLIEEIARHAGHADILREHIDGGAMHPIMAAAEHWPETPWMRAWTPTGDQIVPGARQQVP